MEVAEVGSVWIALRGLQSTNFRAVEVSTTMELEELNLIKSTIDEPKPML